MLQRLRDAAYQFKKRMLVDATLVEGKLKGDDARSRCLLVMDRNSPFENYLLYRMYGEEFSRLRTRRLWVSSLKKVARNLPEQAEFCIAVLPAELDATFSRLTEISSPAIVRQVVDMSGEWTDVKQRFLESRRKTVFNKFMRDDRFSFRISNDPADFDHFYRRMYVPHVQQQFLDSARVDPSTKLEPYFKRGFMLILNEGSTDVAGSLCFFAGDTMFFHRGGVLDGKEEYVRDGAQTALYVAMLRHAKDSKMRLLDLGHSRAFFNDGVYRHKRGWGASVSVDADLDRWLYFFNPNDSARANRVLQQNPMIVRTRDGLMGYYMAAAGDDCTDEGRKRLEKLYFSPGLQGMLLRPASGRQPVVLDFAATAITASQEPLGLRVGAA